MGSADGAGSGAEGAVSTLPFDGVIAAGRGRRLGFATDRGGARTSGDEETVLCSLGEANSAKSMGSATEGFSEGENTGVTR